MDRIVLLGAPASGKGTLARKLSGALALPAVSTGQLLREEERAQTEIGLLSLELSKTGTLVPDAAVIAMMEAWLARHGCRFLSDGFPRTLPQAEAFDTILASQVAPALDHAIVLDAPLHVRRARAMGRLTCSECGDAVPASEKVSVCPSCGAKLERRRDDAEHVFDLRMTQYREKTEPVVDFYRHRGILREVDASGTPEDVFQAALQAVSC